MITRSRPRWQRWGVLAALLAALSGCAVASPVDITKDAANTDVRVVAKIDVQATQVRISYRVENTLGETLWAASAPPALASDPAHPTVSAVPDGSRDGVALALIFFPVRQDLQYVQAPATGVVEVAPHAAAEGTLIVARPFVPFSDLDGDKAVSLPSSPKTVRLCVGYVPASVLPANVRPQNTSGGAPTLARSVAFPLQRIACSDPTPLG